MDLLHTLLYLSSLSYFSQDVLQFVNNLWITFCYVVLLIEIVGDAVELRIRIVAGLNLRTPLNHLRTIVRLNVFPLLGTDGKYVVVRHFGYPWTMGGVGAEQIAKMVLAGNFFAAQPLAVLPCAISCAWHSISGTILAGIYLKWDRMHEKK